jgi:hypothetical protein
MRSERARREIEDALAAGWRIESEGPHRVVLVDREFGSVGGHLVVALLTFWWTMGLGNLVYAAYKYFNDTRRRVVWDDYPGEGQETADAMAVE